MKNEYEQTLAHEIYWRIQQNDTNPHLIYEHLGFYCKDELIENCIEKIPLNSELEIINMLRDLIDF